jgi:hypothetical protein
MTDQQLIRADLDGMTPEQIVEAKDAGRLNALLGIPVEQATTSEEQ